MRVLYCFGFLKKGYSCHLRNLGHPFPPLWQNSMIRNYNPAIERYCDREKKPLSHFETRNVKNGSNTMQSPKPLNP